MRFRLFGIPIEIQFGFWLIAGFLGSSRLQGPYPFLIVEWVAVVLVSILVHELGHAFAMGRHGLPTAITLYAMGGVTSTPSSNYGRLSRLQRIFVSFAGPLAGFILGGLVLGLTYLVPSLGALPTRMSGPAELTIYQGIEDLVWVNIGWGLVNLIPVLPLDGGHILEDALGPRRAKLTAYISIAFGAGVALIGLYLEMWVLAIIFGLAGFTTYQRFRAEHADAPRPRDPKPAKRQDAIPPEVTAQLSKAQAALLDDRFDEAGTIAELVLAGSPPKKARVEALEVIAWAHLLENRPDEAARAIKAIQREGNPDLALVGSVLLAKNELDAAREILEAARAGGDDRKQVVGPLIQILIQQGEVSRAAAIALDILETLSDEDTRQMATIAFDHQAWGWSARLSEALFERTGSPDDAYAGVRSRSLEGDVAGALALLKRAVAAGFSDATRVWSDKALEGLRNDDVGTELETLLPRP